MSPSLPLYDEVDAACRELHLGVDASELHGSLSGWLAGGGDNDGAWLGTILADDALPTPAPDGALDRMRRATAAQLEDRDFAFELLLPDEDAPLYVRSAALFAWCRGFVGAFGLAAGAAPQLSEEASEALGDLVRLSAAEPEDGGDDEDEAALAEIEEFVRVATMLLHGDCVMGPRHRGKLN